MEVQLSNWKWLQTYQKLVLDQNQAAAQMDPVVVELIVASSNQERLVKVSLYLFH